MIGVFSAWLDTATVAEEGGLLGAIADGGDIAYGVECVAQVLYQVLAECGSVDE